MEILIVITGSEHFQLNLAILCRDKRYFICFGKIKLIKMQVNNERSKNG